MKTQRRILPLTLAIAGATACSIVACGGDDNTNPVSTDAGGDATAMDATHNDGPTADSPADTTMGDTGGDGGGDAPSDADAGSVTVTPVVLFNPGMGQLPEQVVIHKGVTYVSFAPTGQIVTVDATGKITPYATVPITQANFLLGFDFDANDNIYVAVAALAAPGVSAAGVWKIPPLGDAGGTAVKWVAGTNLTFANDVQVDPSGTNLYITNSGEGAVYQAPVATATLNATAWKIDPLLQGDVDPDAGPACNNRPGAGFPIGANDLEVTANAVFVSNTDKGSLVTVPINGGAPGTASNVFQNCMLKGFDGFTKDSTDGSYVVAIASANQLLRVSGTGMGTITPIAGGSPTFDFTDSVIQVPGATPAETFLVTNGAYFTAMADGGMPHPSLLKVVIQ